MSPRLVGLFLLASGCSALDGAADAGPDVDGGGGDAMLGDGGADCARLAAEAPEWLAGAIDDDVAALSGEVELDEGGFLVDRSTLERRAATRAYLRDRLVDMGYVWFDHNYGSGINVYAELTADAPAGAEDVEAIVIGAHYDTVPSSPGANDNATGVAMALALARGLATTTCRARTVLFVFFDEEEIGLVGSAAFANELIARELRVHSVHTVDQMGWDQDGNRGIELEKPDDTLLPRYQEAALARAIPIRTTDVDTTDHEAFRERGFVAIGLTEEYLGGDTTPHYHLPSDTYDTVDVGFAASIAWFWGHVVDALAAEQPTGAGR